VKNFQYTSMPPSTTTQHNEKPLPCSIKSPKTLQLGESPFYSGCSIIEATFSGNDPPDINKITLVNNYAASVTIKAKMRRESKEGRKEIWKTAVKDFKLMPNPHCETGGQSYFTIYPDDLLCSVTQVLMLRFIVMQPSPSWSQFSIEEIYIFGKSKATSSSVASPTVLPKWITEKSKSRRKPHHDATDLDVNEISKLTQQLMMLSTKASDASPNVKLGRFDVDGSYEINLLTYT